MTKGRPHLIQRNLDPDLAARYTPKPSLLGAEAVDDTSVWQGDGLALTTQFINCSRRHIPQPFCGENVLIWFSVNEAHDYPDLEGLC
jgi:hypothetical protein